MFFTVLISRNDKKSKNKTGQIEKNRTETIKWINKTFKEMEFNTKEVYSLPYINNIKNSFFEKDSTCINIIWYVRMLQDTMIITSIVPYNDVIVYQTKKGNNFIALGLKPKNGCFKGTMLKNGRVQMIEYNKEKPMIFPFDNTLINQERINQIVKELNYLIEKYGNQSVTEIDFQ